VAFYIVAICLMLWRAWALVGGGRHPPRLAVLAALGATAFALSDLLVAYNRFIEPVLALQVLLMVLYWGAQWLITASVVRDRTSRS
jgi:alkenylglycerophosphocholine/alkenylglycerophosphoethanolamine hydrolase